MFLIDSHCHLNHLNYNTIHTDVEDVLKKAAHNDVQLVLTVATTLSEYREITNLLGNHPKVTYTCGIHPLNIDQNTDLIDLPSLAKNRKVVALGETGLDYYNNKKDKVKQQFFFREHIRIGCNLSKPVIVHTRNAQTDTLTILREEQADICGGVLHCFTEDRQMAKLLLNMGFYISFSGIVTFSNAIKLREIVSYIPLDRLLIETDSPYLAPVPYRGKENQPAWLREIASCIATIKQISIVELAAITTNNFCSLFGVNLQIK
ncbi:MAG: YchF/TatD family DNA exonuclease [Candidatus Dasytiphilus stammeri]